MFGVTLIRRALMGVVVAGGVLVVGLVAERAVLNSGDDPPMRWDVAADVQLAGLDLQQVGAGGPELAIKAQQARLLEPSQTVLADQLEVWVYEAGQEAARLTAERGEVQLESRQISIFGDTTPALLTVTNGPTLAAPALHWNPDDRTVHTTGGATITQPGFSATGAESVVQMDENILTMSGGVTVIWTPEG